ncbi:MAG: hypothetical protein ACLUSX_11290 [Ruminococcus sp.]|uniref:hypothetical protein n=1 Tax=Ruminococcus sp. TaxID=41978 RepID=UPI00399612CF
MSQTIHRNTIEFEVCGDYALFSDVLTRPSGEKCTYDIPTYEGNQRDRTQHLLALYEMLG